MSILSMWSDGDHPPKAEPVGDHAETRGPERLAERHLHMSPVCQRGKGAIGFGFIRHREGERKSLKICLPLAESVRCHHGRITDTKTDMHHLVLGAGRQHTRCMR